MTGVALTYQIIASGLPPGLNLNPSTGTISGTPSQAGIYDVVLDAIADGGTATATLTLTVTSGPSVVTVGTVTASAFCAESLLLAVGLR